MDRACVHTVAPQGHACTHGREMGLPCNTECTHAVEGRFSDKAAANGRGAAADSKTAETDNDDGI